MNPSSVRSALAAVLAFVATSCLKADSLLNFHTNGTFYSVGLNNDFGAPQLMGGLDYLLDFSFFAPNTPDQLPANPNRGLYGTTGFATVTANGVTLNYQGAVSLEIKPDPLGTNYGDVYLTIHRSGGGLLSVNLVDDYEGPLLPDDTLASLFHFPTAAYIDAGGCYNDLDEFKLVSVTEVSRDQGFVIRSIFFRDALHFCVGRNRECYRDPVCLRFCFRCHPTSGFLSQKKSENKSCSS